MEHWIKLHRKILDSQVFAHPTALKIWVWILAKAGYSERYVPFKINRGSTTIKLQAGQFIFGRFKAEEELNIDGSTIYKWIQKFASEEFDMISIQSNNHYTIVTVSNWEQYQNGETKKEQPKNSQVTAKEQPCNTNKNIYKVKNIVPPKFELLKSYCEERKNNIDAQNFFDYYQASGWVMKGGRKMKDWQAAVRTWEKNNKKFNKPSAVVIPEFSQGPGR